MSRARRKYLLKGKVTSVDSASGKLTLGKQVVDYSDLLSKGSVSVSVGTLLTVVGIQPLADGLILANAIR